MESHKASIISIGERLKDAREKKALTIGQVQKQTRIHSSVISALEEGRCDEILTPTYVKSFLKKYSQALGLDPKEMLKDYETVRGRDEVRPAINIPVKVDKPDSIIPKFIYALSLFIIILLLIAGGILLARGTARFLKTARYARKIALTKAVKTENLKIKQEAPSSVPKKGPFTLTLKTKQAVLVKVKKDGVALFSRVLAKGSSESFTADNKMELYIAKAEAVELILNGKSLGPSGRGIVKNLEITSKGIKR